MERFAINILHKRIHKICRLCGVDQPHKIPILEGIETIIVGDEDEEASLAKKIEECVGIQVSKDDKMPQNICSLCVDKINDFYEYRLMCAATNLQTRTILNLNLVEPTRKLLNFGELPKLEPSVKEEEKKDVKKVVEVATSSSSSISPSTGGKKGKKRKVPPSPSPSPGPTTRIKTTVDVKDEPVPAVPVKALTKKERMKQLQQEKEKDEKKQREKEEKKKKEEDRKDRRDDKQKKEKHEDKTIDVEHKQTRSKRKEPSPAKDTVEKVEPSVPPPKKIKFEHPCSYCTDEFKTQTELDGHLGIKHVPMIRKFGCGSCRETFETILESKDHNLWHQLTRTLYTCFKCKRKYDKNMALVKHMALNACGRIARGRPPIILPDIQCRLCNKKFKTQNLYEWHGCFLKPKTNCPKCGKFFVKKQILTRHYMMFCTGTLPPPEPVIIPKVEPLDSAEKPSTGPSATTNPDRRTRRAVVEPELPKEEREIPFPPPLELASEAHAEPSVAKKKPGRKVSFQDQTIKPTTPVMEAEKIASLLTSGAKLDRDTDIATINNLLSSVTEAIASISEAKAKKKKKKKDKHKDRVPTPADEVPKTTPEVISPPIVEASSPAVETPPPAAPTPTTEQDNRTAEEIQAYKLAQEVGEMTLDQQLAFCAGKLPIVVLSKTTFKQECTEIDTEPSQLQEPMHQEDGDQINENGAEDDSEYDNGMDDYCGFQNDDEDEPPADEEAPSLPTDSTAQKEDQHTEELPFPIPIKQEIDSDEPPATTETLRQAATAPPEEPSKKVDKEPVFDEKLASNIKKEPGMDDEQESATKRKCSEVQHSSVASPVSSLSSSQSSPKPTLILKIKKEKGLLNSTVETVKQIRTIVLDDDDDDDDEECGMEKRVIEAETDKSRNKVYKKPNNLAVRIKQEKVDPAYERHEPIGADQTELPTAVRIKQERLDPDEEPPCREPKKPADLDNDSPPLKKPRSSNQEKLASPIIAFDGVRIKREKSDQVELAVEKQTASKEDDCPKPVEKRKKSKVKINPFALLRQKMAAEAAATTANAQAAAAPQSPSPLPVITNVVGNASASSVDNTPTVESTPDSDKTVPVIAQVTSMAAAQMEPSELESPVAVKEEPIDEVQEQEEEEDQRVENDFPLPIKLESPEGTDASDKQTEESQEPEFPMPIKAKLDEESHRENVVESSELQEKGERLSEAESVCEGSEQNQPTEEKLVQEDVVATDAVREEPKEHTENVESADRMKSEETNNEQALVNQLLSESIDEPETSTSPISDVPMDDYDQNSRENASLSLANDEQPLEPCGSREPEKSADADGPSDETSVETTSTIPDRHEPVPTDGPSNETPLETTSTMPDRHEPVPMDDLGKETPLDTTSTMSDRHESVSEEPEPPVLNVIDQPSPIVTATTPLESELEELQNLLTEGLKHPNSVFDSAPSDASGDRNMVDDGCTVANVGNNVAMSRLDEDLESLLNNKIEEISDQFRQPKAPESSTTAVPPQDELNLAIERELLHEMLPSSTDNGLRTEMSQMSNNTASDHGSNSVLEVERSLMLEATGSGNQQLS